MSERSPAIKLDDYFHTDKICNVCKGPLELNRDASCCKCKLRTRLETFHNVIETAMMDTRRAVKQYI